MRKVNREDRIQRKINTAKAVIGSMIVLAVTNVLASEKRADKIIWIVEAGIVVLICLIVYSRQKKRQKRTEMSADEGRRQTMRNNEMNEKKNKKSTLIGVLVAVGVMLFSIITELADIPTEILTYFIISVIVIAFVISGVIIYAKKKSGTLNGSTGKVSTSSAEVRRKVMEAAKAKKLADLSGDWTKQHETEKAIGCTCLHGKDKYIHQAEEFYRNGLIDKEELELLRERYEKLKLPEGIVD